MLGYFFRNWYINKYDLLSHLQVNGADERELNDRSGREVKIDKPDRREISLLIGKLLLGFLKW